MDARPRNGTHRREARVARADPGADRPRATAGVAMALIAGAPGRLRCARGGHARALRREPGWRVRPSGATAAGRAGGGAAGTCRLVGRLAVGAWADTRHARGVPPGRDPPAAAGTVVEVGAEPHPVV